METTTIGAAACFVWRWSNSRKRRRNTRYRLETDGYVLESGIDPKMLTTKTSEVMYMDNGNMFLAGMTASDEIERTLQMTAWRQQLKRYCNIVVTEIQEVSQHGHYADVDEDAGKVDEVSIKKITKVPPKTNDRSNVKRRASASVAKAVEAVQGKRRKKNT